MSSFNFQIVACSGPDDANGPGDAATENDTQTEARDCRDIDSFELDSCAGLDFPGDCVIHVDGSASAPGDGLSWQTPFKSVQKGIDTAHCGAVASDKCDVWQVWVRAGTYFISKGCYWDTVRLRPHVALYGGFNGTETTLHERNFDTNKTVLDGRDSISNNNQVYHVVSGSDDARLDGFTVSHGWAPLWGTETDISGGGMVNINCSPVVANCIFSHNEAMWGGAITARNNSLTILDSVFEKNTAWFGGALESMDSDLLVRSCTFKDNRVRQHGGAIFVQGGSLLEESSSFIENLSSKSGGGIYLGYGNETKIDRCTFEKNQTASFRGQGGGLCVSGSDINISNSTFVSNHSSTAGGGIYSSSAQLVVVDTSFNENSAHYTGGGLTAYSGESSIKRCEFSGNSADVGGGGLSLSDKTSAIQSSVFVDNKAAIGGGILSGSGSHSITNCSLTGNTATGSAGGIYAEAESISVINSILWNNPPIEIAYRYLDHPHTVGYSNIQGGFEGAGNIHTDPLFVNAPGGDLRLEAASGCIDAANGDVAPATDFQGNSRYDDPNIDNSGTGNPNYTDMGAYEYNQE